MNLEQEQSGPRKHRVAFVHPGLKPEVVVVAGEHPAVPDLGGEEVDGFPAADRAEASS